MSLWYCRYHDFAFCEPHVGQCLRGNHCILSINPNAVCCAVCQGILQEQPKELTNAAANSQAIAASAETDEPDCPDPDYQV